MSRLFRGFYTKKDDFYTDAIQNNWLIDLDIKWAYEHYVHLIDDDAVYIFDSFPRVLQRRFFEKMEN